MISVRGGGGRVKNGRKGMELGFQNGDMGEEPELEEGEASFDTSIDPDVALSYLDEKLQHVLGHFQKDFEGGVSAENLGSKFGGYGSFLPTYQRSPSWSRPKSSPEVSQNRGRSPNPMHLEGARRNSVSASSNIQSAGPRLTSSTAHGLKAPSGNDQVNPGVGVLSSRADDLPSKVEPDKVTNCSDQKALKFRIKVGVDNSLTGKNAEIYSGLGLDVSPSSSLDNSPSDSDMYHDHQEIIDESPTNILQIMSSIRPFGGSLLSPLSDNVTQLSGSGGPLGKGQAKPGYKLNSGSSRLPVSGFDLTTSGERKPKLLVEHGVSEPSSNKNKDYQNSSCTVLKKDGVDTSACEKLVSCTLKLPLLSNSLNDVAHLAKDTVKPTTKPSKNGIKSSAKVEEDLESVAQNGRAEKINKKARKPNYVDEHSAFHIKAESLVKRESDTYEERKSIKVEDILKPKVGQKVPSHNEDILKHKVDQKVASHDMDGSKSAPRELQSLSGGKKKSKVGLGPSVLSTEFPENGSLFNSSVVAKGKKPSDSDGLRKGPGKADKYKEFFGDLDIEQNDEEIASQEMTSGPRLKVSELVEKNGLSGRNIANDRVNGAGSHPKLLPSRPRPVHDANTPMVAPLVQEDWVACDRCQTWRLLPLGTNPDSLPEKWLCSMLDWLPAMNHCSISEEETTKALRALYQPQPYLVPLVAASGSQLDQHANSCQTSLGVAVGDGRRSNEYRHNSGLQAIQATSSAGKRKGGTQNHSSLEEFGSQYVDQPNGSFGDKYGTEKEKRILLDINCEEGGVTKSKVKDRKENDTDLQRATKKIKAEDQLNRDENHSTDLGGASSKAGRSSNSVSGKDFRKCINISKGDPKKLSVSSDKSDVQISIDDAQLKIDQSGYDGSMKKRKQSQQEDGNPDSVPFLSSEHHTHTSRAYLEDGRGSEGRRDKKARVSKSEGKDSSGSKYGSVSGKKGRGRRDLDGSPSRRSMDVVGPWQPSLAATSSSSKVSSSRKSKTSLQEVKDSPVESVSSSPRVVSVTDKLVQVRKNIVAKDNSQDVECFPSASPRRSLEREDIGVGDPSVKKKDSSFNVLHRGSLESTVLDFRGRDSDYRSATGNVDGLTELVTQSAPNSKTNALSQGIHQTETSEQNQNLGKGSTSKAKEKSYNSIAGLENGNETAREEIVKAERVKYPERSSSSSDRTEKHSMYKKDPAGKLVEDQSHISGRDSIITGPDVITSQEKQNALQDSDNERSSRKLVSDKTGTEVLGRGKSHSLPPTARGQTDTATRLMPIAESQNEYGEHREHDAKLRATKQLKKAEKQNGNQHSSLRYPTPPSQKGRDIEAPSPARKDSSSQRVTTAVKDAKDLKHLADRLKNSGSPDSTGYYFQAALKFLHGSSLLESGNGEIIQCTQMYNSTAKLCEFCAHEYEKSKDMAAAALAYKCAEVAYLRVVYTSHNVTSRDRNELLAALQITPTGESPSSSASDIDNLNHQVAVERGVQVKIVGSPHIAGNHVLTARNRSSCVRLITYAQGMNNAMEASRKSQNAFAAANARVDTAKHKEGISSVKKALDFNFQDVEGLLHLVRVAIEAVEFQLKTK